MPTMIQRLALFALVLASGCQLYWGNGDDVCNYMYGEGALVPAQELRNPQTGICQPIGGGGGGCNSMCGPCPYEGDTGVGSGAAEPDWGACYGSCEGLSEGSCLASPYCHAAYLDNPVDAGGHQFWACWEIPPSGAITGGSCVGLDAQSCSEHTDCISNFNSAKYNAGTQEFQSCAAETQRLCTADAQCGANARCDTSTCHSQPCPTCDACGACPPDDTCYGVCVPTVPDLCATADCGPGSHCEQQCYPCDPPAPNGCMDACKAMCIPDTTCANVDCGPGYTCLDTCTTMTTTSGPGTCYPECVPTTNDPGSCTGPITCTTQAPACPSNTTAGRANGCYTGYCIPNAQCGPNDPGACYGQVTCLTGEPSCPAGTVAGIKNGCWSGYCIPDAACPPPPCASVATEAACKSRNDCIPVYDGMNCTCYPDHCDCQSETYARCESALMPL